MIEGISQAVIAKVLHQNLHLLKCDNNQTTKSATGGKYHFNHPKLGFVFPLNATEHAQFHAVFQCKDQDYKFVIHSMSDPCLQFCWKCVLDNKQNFKLTYFPKYSIFILKHPNCTKQGPMKQPRAKIPSIKLVFYGKSPVVTDLT